MTVNIGDIFSVPIGGNRLGYGQVVEKYRKVLLYCVFFSNLLPPEIQCVPSNVLLAGITTTAKIKSGDWKILLNETSGLKDMALPRFKVVMNCNLYVEDLSEQIRRTILPEEADTLPFRSIVAPIRYEKALAAYFGTGKWQQPYDKLLYQNIIKSNEVSLK